MAEPTQGNPGASASAAGEELSIPKHRFDEVNNELRRVREDQSMKDRLYLEERQRWQAAQRQPAVADITPEESGLDPAVHQAAVKIAAKIAERIVDEKTQVFQQQIGILAGRTEKAELLSSKGADKVKYLPEIQARQRDHYNATGSFLPAEIALDLILSKEKDQRIAALEARLAGAAPAAGAAAASPGSNAASTISAPAGPAATGGVPNAAGTRQMPGGGNAGQGPSPAGTTFGSLSLEEMEAQLEKQFKEGVTL